MFTIFFNLYNNSDLPFSIEVAGIEDAREAWDRLSREFFMRSARP